MLGWARRRQAARYEGELRSLSMAAYVEYREAWQRVEARFAAEPRAGLRDADRLLHSLLRDRGQSTKHGLPPGHEDPGRAFAARAALVDALLDLSAMPAADEPLSRDEAAATEVRISDPRHP